MKASALFQQWLSYIICKKDPFKEGLPCYTIEQTCKENPKITEKINDKTHKVFYNASKCLNTASKIPSLCLTFSFVPKLFYLRSCLRQLNSAFSEVETSCNAEFLSGKMLETLTFEQYYIATSKTESDLTDRIDCAVERAKKNQSWRKKFMTLKEYTYRQYKDEMDGWRNLVAEKDEQLSCKDEQLRDNAEQLRKYEAYFKEHGITLK